MPNLKRRLSRLEEATHRDYLRQLQAEGIDVEIPENSRALDIVLEESMVFESATGGVHYAVLTRLVPERSGFIVTGWELNTDYDDQIVPESFDDRHLIFRLGGQEYCRREVLNPRMEKIKRSPAAKWQRVGSWPRASARFRLSTVILRPRRFG
jgi:hypothetical protein